MLWEVHTTSMRYNSLSPSTHTHTHKNLHKKANIASHVVQQQNGNKEENQTPFHILPFHTWPWTFISLYMHAHVLIRTPFQDSFYLVSLSHNKVADVYTRGEERRTSPSFPWLETTITTTIGQVKMKIIGPGRCGEVQCAGVSCPGRALIHVFNNSFAMEGWLSWGCLSKILEFFTPYPYR